jgi:hypothetical protein
MSLTKWNQIKRNGDNENKIYLRHTSDKFKISLSLALCKTGLRKYDTQFLERPFLERPSLERPSLERHSLEATIPRTDIP